MHGSPEAVTTASFATAMVNDEHGCMQWAAWRTVSPPHACSGVAHADSPVQGGHEARRCRGRSGEGTKAGERRRRPATADLEAKSIFLPWLKRRRRGTMHPCFARFLRAICSTPRTEQTEDPLQSFVSIVAQPEGPAQTSCRAETSAECAGVRRPSRGPQAAAPPAGG